MDSLCSYRVLFLIALLATSLTHGPTMVSAQASNQTTIRIAVPPKSGFTQFVKVILDPVTGKRNFSGFSIEVFNQAVSATVDKSTVFEFVPFERPDGTMNGTYDDMVKAVFDKQYDGAVGDITIRYSRTSWVDFTVSYSDIGISMLIPIQRETAKKAANSLISFAREMVIGTFIFFFLSIIVFVGYDMTTLLIGGIRNHAGEQNEQDWRREMLGTVKGTRLMMLLWFVILLFLITYYATSLISLLAKEQLIAPNKTLNQIIRTGEKVGYPRGSFVLDLLKEVGLSEKQLFPYLTEGELLDMLNKGSGEGGVTVAIDETPPLSVFLAQHCNSYALVPIPSFHSSGYGFAFRKGSRLVQEVSNGIIKIIDNGQLGRIRARTIGGIGTCDVYQGFDAISDIGSAHISKAFKVCAIVTVALLGITYAVFVMTTNRSCLRFLFR